MLKLCGDCRKHLPIEKFASNQTKKDGLQGSCKKCRAKYNKRHYRENKEKYLDRAKKRKIKLKKWYKEYKSKLMCKRCGENHVACLQFHHIDPTEKRYTVATMPQNCISIEKMKQEISKCEVLCANCHAKEHYKQAHKDLHSDH